MTATLRVVLDQFGTTTDPDLLIAERELTRALIRTAPAGCDVAGIVPAGDEQAAGDAVPGLVAVARAGLPRRELAAAWQVGLATGAGGGMVHAPSLFAPIVRHDRVHDGDQTIVTLWDLRAWERPESMSRSAVMWQKAMLRRAEKHADAVVVPTHAMAEALGSLSKLGQRIRVIPGAAPEGFAAPADAEARRGTFQIPDAAVVLDGSASPAELTALFAALSDAGLDVPLVVLDVPREREEWLVDAATSAGYPLGSLHVRGALPDEDRAAVLSGATAYLSPAADTAFPWRLIEALALGVPVVAAESASHRELLLDDGIIAPDAAATAASLASLRESDAERRRQGVRAADRGRAFSWSDAAARVWALHAEL
jgi:glycosyltransferase involved in cell wall biosynthesis